VWIASNPGEIPLGRHLLVTASDVGDPTARAVIAAAHITGEYGIQPDVERGLWDLRQMVDAGNVDACWHLGRILYDGLNLPQDQKIGALLIRKAAAAGFELAQERVSKMHLTTAR
jgi:TPR repeat protein